MDKYFHKNYIEYLEKKYNSRIKEFNTRFQGVNDKEQVLRIEFESGRVISKPLFHSNYGDFFYNYDRESCYDCCFKGDYRQADLTIGDSWVKDECNLGKSIIYIHNHKGDFLVKKLLGFQLKEIDYKDVKKDNPAINYSLPRTTSSIKLKHYYSGNRIRWSIFKSRDIKGKLKYVIREIFYLIK